MNKDYTMKLSRRTFVRAAATVPFLSAASYGRILGANDRLQVAFIGTGEWEHFMQQILQSA